ncbi:amidohydrolase family protein [Pedobacter sp.]|uniref:amidohydrolase family protein n=1 Tax=Pedobacter sp. TaxID=1411316 RepID=UPI003D7FC658
MLKIDGHQHFWKYNPERDDWITEDMAVLREDYLPQQLEPLLKQHGFSGSVVIQSAQNREENIFQLKNAVKHEFIKGVVGWVDLQAEDIEKRLESLMPYEKLKGFRHVLQGEKDRALMLSPAFQRGISALTRYGYTYDLLILPDQLVYARELVSAHPNQAFIVDHLAKPAIKAQDIDEWAEDIKSLAQHENVYCKASGMVTEADMQHWKKEDFRPYLDVLFETFGTGRLIFGSDWPVCLLAASYAEVFGVMDAYLKSFSKDEQAQFWGLNALDFYQISI